jgi:hypothetical protein
MQDEALLETEGPFLFIAPYPDLNNKKKAHPKGEPEFSNIYSDYTISS